MKANELLKQFLLEKVREEINYYSDEKVIINTFTELIQYYKDNECEEDLLNFISDSCSDYEYLDNSTVLRLFEFNGVFVVIEEKMYPYYTGKLSLFTRLLESIETAYFVKPVTKITYEPV